MATNLLQEKINILRNQINQGELELFNNKLIIEDTLQSSGDEKVDNDLKRLAVQAHFNVTHWNHKLASRKILLADLEAQAMKATVTPPQ